jgi:peptidoglycan/xylan/chitin deacetylase (PgdA/CDA1 family)
MKHRRAGLRRLIATGLFMLVAALNLGDVLAASPAAEPQQAAARAETAAAALPLAPRDHPIPALRYRPVGCRVSGPRVAYTRGARRREVALSFDDGPAPLTTRFVRMLRADHAVATFFMTGEQVDPGYRSPLREELRSGDALGDHSWSHPDLRSSADVSGQLRATREAIRRETGYTPCVFRPPYGDYDTAVIDAARALGLATILWDVDPSDYTLPGVGAIEQRVLAQTRPGSIILSHDGGGPRAETLAAYPYIIRVLRRRGYRFVTVPQLLGFRTVYRTCTLRCEGTAIAGRPPSGSIVEG